MLTRARPLLVRLGWGVLAAATVALLVTVGGLTTTSPVVALLVAVTVLGFGLTLMDAAIIPLLMLLPLLVVIRVNAGGTNLSLSDFTLFTAFWPALLFATRPYSPALRSLLLLSVAYQASTLLTVVANPYQANTVEWFHAWLLTAGALVVGWSVGREGHARLGLTLLLGGSVFLAAATVVQGLVQYAHGNFDPVYPTFPYPMHKNFVGCLLGIAAITAYVRPGWARWPRTWALAAFWICAVGIVVAQSRQALVALGVALVFVTMRTDPNRKRSRIILLAVAPALGAVGMLVKNQAETGNEYNSLFQRINWFEDSLQVWHYDYLFGAGLRWWYTDRFPVRFQPPNAEVEMLSSAGLIGLLGFVVLMGGTLYVLWRLDPTYGVLATAVVLSRLVQGQLDLFWVSAQVSVPFVIAGICLGAQARAVEVEPVVPPGRRRDRGARELAIGAD
jgi:hypothetical protein